jgi:membrane-associated phospholipid phosphatase
LLGAAPALAQLPALPPPRLLENFSPTEIALTTVASGTAIFLLTAGKGVLGAPHPGMGVPHPQSLDARLSRRWYAAEGSDRRFLGGAPAGFGATVLPLLPLAYYGANTLALAARDRPLWPAGEVNASHKLMGYLEAVGWTYFVTAFAKLTTGRSRPYVANNHLELRERASEDHLSFFSLHASGSMAVGAFVAEDVSRTLRHGPLAQAAPVTRALLGVALPYGVGYGLPLVIGASRIVDQQHWPSDVLIGWVTGGLVAHLAYGAHFDGRGQPRRRRGDVDRVVGAVAPMPLAGPGGAVNPGLGVSGWF